MATEADWIRTPHIRPDRGGPVERPYSPFVDPAAAPPVIAMLEAVAAEMPDDIAMDGDDGPVSFRAFVEMARRLRDRIERASAGCGPVGILLSPSIAYAAAVFGCLAARRVCVAMDDSFPDERNEAIAAAAGVRLLLVDPARRPAPVWRGIPALDATGERLFTGPAPPPASEFLGLDEPAFILCTSGSTGAPKPIAHSQRTMLHWARTTHDALHVRPDDRVLSASSLSSLGGFTALVSYPLAGASIQLFDVKASGLGGLLGTLARRPVTVLRAAPSLLRTATALPEASAALRGLRIVQTYGEPFLKDDLVRFRETLPSHCHIRSTYGSTEASGLSFFVSGPDNYDRARVATGFLMPDTAAAIVDDQGCACPPGEMGELLIRSRYNALGEWSAGGLVAGSPETVLAGGERIFRTGDFARYHPDGVFVVFGRKDRMLKVNGQRLEPAEIERALRRLPGIEAAEIVVDDEGGRAKIVAIIAPRRVGEPNRGAAIRAELRASLPAFMVPSRVVEVDAIPLLPSGKADLAALRNIARATARSG